MGKVLDAIEVAWRVAGYRDAIRSALRTEDGLSRESTLFIIHDDGRLSAATREDYLVAGHRYITMHPSLRQHLADWLTEVMREPARNHARVLVPVRDGLRFVDVRVS